MATPSGGRHLYFHAPAGRIVTSSSGDRSGLGARIGLRGRAYRIEVDAAIAELPLRRD